MMSERQLDVDMSGMDPVVFMAQLRSGVWQRFAEEAAAVGHCTKPVALHGWSATHDKDAFVLPLTQSETKTINVRCGNRRASVCPSCARLYARDTFEMIVTGLCGGKGVPAERVQHRPAVFATVTAPSFGKVHGPGCGRSVSMDQMSAICEHGEYRWCPGGCDDKRGQALCGQCYDYEGHVLWNWSSTDLWRRFTIGLHRAIAQRLGMTLKELTETEWRARYVKVAEFQARGAIHFHALIRWDGPADVITGNMLQVLVEDVARAVEANVKIPDGGKKMIRFGDQVDVKLVQDAWGPDAQWCPEKAAGYLAKYASKATTDEMAAGTPHAGRLERAVLRLMGIAKTRWALGGNSEKDQEWHGRWSKLGKRRKTAGFRGHFSSKSPRWSVTLGALRRMRWRFRQLSVEARSAGGHVDMVDLEARLLAPDFEEQELRTHQVGEWAYVGSGWGTNEGLVRALAEWEIDLQKQRKQQEREHEHAAQY